MSTQIDTPNTPAARFRAFLEEAAIRGNRIYIAGPMTGLPDFNFPAFNFEAALLRNQGLHVENPAEHGTVDGAEWADYLRYDIGRLATCGAIYLLKGWENSKGAQLEVHIARTLGMEVMYAPGAMSVLQAERRQRPMPVVAQAPQPGYVLVPVEPTAQMLTAGSNDLRLGGSVGTLTRAAECYRAMLAEAPKAPQQAAPTTPADPLDWPLPCDIKAGGVTIRKGCPLRTVQTRLQVQSEGAALLFKKIRALSPQPEAQSVPDGEPSNVELRGMWYGAGGSFHGPSVETGTMPEAKLLPFLRSLMAAPRPEAAAMTREQAHALRKGHEIAATDAYFEARPDIDSIGRRKTFESGFQRGWDAALAVEGDKP